MSEKEVFMTKEEFMENRRLRMEERIEREGGVDKVDAKWSLNGLGQAIAQGVFSFSGRIEDGKPVGSKEWVEAKVPKGYRVKYAEDYVVGYDGENLIVLNPKYGLGVEIVLYEGQGNEVVAGVLQLG